MDKQPIGTDSSTGNKIYVGDLYYSFKFENDRLNTLFRPMFLCESARDKILMDKLEGFRYTHYSKQATYEDHKKYNELLEYITTEKYNTLLTKYLSEEKVFISIYPTFIFIKQIIETNNETNNEILKDFKLLKLIN